MLITSAEERENVAAVNEETSLSVAVREDITAPLILSEKTLASEPQNCLRSQDNEKVSLKEKQFLICSSLFHNTTVGQRISIITHT